MSQFIESIRLKDGQIFLLSAHEQRMNQTRKDCLNFNTPISLTFLSELAKNHLEGLFKCRLWYSHSIEKIQLLPYRPRPIQSLQIVNSDLEYTFKSADRTTINSLFSQRGNCDDVLIIKNDRVTDASYSNVAFFDGTNWLTPSTPLLNGVQRQFLLKKNIIQEQLIHKTDIFQFEKAKLFNAMMDWENAPEVLIENINL